MKWLPLAKRPANPSWARLASHLIAPLILLIAFGLRLWRLGDANLWWDEALAIWAVRKGFVGVTLWTAADVHPPLYFWSLWAWVQLTGESEFAMRFLSVIWGLLTVAIAYRLGCMLGNYRKGESADMGGFNAAKPNVRHNHSAQVVGALAATLTGLSRFHVWWSQEMRMYVLAGLLGLLSLYTFLLWIRTWCAPGPPTSTRSISPDILLAGNALASVGALFTIFLMAPLLLVQNLVFLVAWIPRQGEQRRRLFARWALSQVAIGALVGLWLALSWGRMRTWSVAEPFSLSLFVRLYATLLTTGVSVHIERYSWAVILPFVILVFGGTLGLLRWRRERGEHRIEVLAIVTLALVVVVPAAVVYLSTMPRSLFYTPKVEARYLLPFAPAFWVLLAWAANNLRIRWRAVGWGGIVALLALWIAVLPEHYSDRHLRDELQTMVRAIASQAEPGDVVLLDSGDRYPIFLYYYDRLSGAGERSPMIQMPHGGPALGAEEADSVLRPLAASYRRFWLAEVDADLHDPERLIAQWLSDRYPRVALEVYGHNTLHLFDPNGQPATLRTEGYALQHALSVPLGSNGRLLGWEMPVHRYSPGDSVHISLLWERPPSDLVEVTLRNQYDQALAVCRPQRLTGDAPQRQQCDFQVHPGTPTGRYQIVVSADPLEGDSLWLGTLEVTGEAPKQKESPEIVVGAHLEEGITLVGYTLRSANRRGLERLHPGDCLVLDLYWQNTQNTARDVTVFTHLLGQAHNPVTQGPVWGQHDSQPANGGLPTSRWHIDEIVVDRHLIEIMTSAPAGSYQLAVGMYDAINGDRLRTVHSSDGEPEDQILLPARVMVIP